MKFRTVVAKLFLVFVAASFSLVGAHAQPADPMSPAVRAAWGFDRSDLTPHPGVRFGVLANGMRYALMRTAEPGLSARLHIDAGSTVEGEREQGYMHLIEHLIFHGSANLPQGALPLMLRHQGLRRWSDFNAFTSLDETVYRLDLPRADQGARTTALTLMREIATNLRFTRRTVEGAKAMVATEIGERDALLDRVTTARNAFFLPGTLVARGSVASTQASVRRAQGAVLRRLYTRYYAPRRATLVLVGDFDPAALEPEISARFADWPGRESPDDASPPPAIVRTRGTQARLFVDRAATTSVAIAVVEPLGGADAGERRDAVFLEHLGSEMLNRRLARAAAAANAPFVSASSAIYDHFSTARFSLVEVAARNRDWRGALRAGARELGRALRDGFSQSELNAQLAASRAALAADAGPQTRSALADAIVDAVGREIIFTAPSDGSATQAYLSRVRLADVNAAFRGAWANPSRLIFVSHDQRIAEAETAIVDLWAESAAVAARGGN